mmetsp:Transcript_27641/g.59092  ORF Transcript_27641/g.59092 Transcript_27641/m.59092 type:complete len:509 (+) Transcript_27641:111-1637(+)
MVVVYHHLYNCAFRCIFLPGSVNFFPLTKGAVASGERARDSSFVRCDCSRRVFLLRSSVFVSAFVSGSIPPSPIGCRRDAGLVVLLSVVGEILEGRPIVHVSGLQNKPAPEIRNQRHVLRLGIVLESKHDPKHQVLVDDVFLVPLEFPQIEGLDRPAYLVVRREGTIALRILLAGDCYVAVLPRDGGTERVVEFRQHLPGDAVLEDDLVGPVGAPPVLGGGFDDDGIVPVVGDSSLGIDGGPVHVLDPVVGVVAGGGVLAARGFLVGPVLDLAGFQCVGQPADVEIGLDTDDVVVQETGHVVPEACPEPGRLRVVLVVVAHAGAVPGLEESAHLDLDLHDTIGHQREGRQVVVVPHDADNADLQDGPGDPTDLVSVFGKLVPPHGFPGGLFEDAHEVFGDHRPVPVVLDDREEGGVFGTVQAKFQRGVAPDLPVRVEINGLSRGSHGRVASKILLETQLVGQSFALEGKVPKDHPVHLIGRNVEGPTQPGDPVSRSVSTTTTDGAEVP